MHSLAQAEAALRAAQECGKSVILESPPDAARSWGAPYFLALIAAARAAVPDVDTEAVLDCGTAPGLAMDALRRGVKIVRIRDRDDVTARLADMAARLGARVETSPCPADALDLDRARDAYEAARHVLATAAP